jgi:putative hydrolase of HD superfamily
MKSHDKKNKKSGKAAPSARPSQKTAAAIDFFAEAGLLKRIKRSGWWVAGIKDPESVAEHCFRCAVIGYYLAHLEKADPYRVVTMCLFNDIHESRINDLHKMGHYYIDFKDAEKKVFRDQIEFLDAKVQAELKSFRDDYDGQGSKESVIARDADILECLLQAKEYYDNGYTGAKEFFNRAPDFLRTTNARKMWRQIKQWNSRDWWKKVVKFER